MNGWMNGWLIDAMHRYQPSASAPHSSAPRRGFQQWLTWIMPQAVQGDASMLGARKHLLCILNAFICNPSTLICIFTTYPFEP